MKLYLNGKIIPDREAAISPLDRGFILGDGLFETMRSYQGRIFLIREHLDRLCSSAHALKIKIPLPKKRLAEACEETIQANHIKSARVRITVSRGGDAQGSTILITASVIKPGGARPLKLVKGDLSISKNSPLAKHKTISRLPYLYACNQAREKGADDALLFTEDGILLESTRANLFLVKNRQLKTPSLDLPILPGITRAKLIELARGRGIKVIEGQFTEKDLISSDLAFLTNSIIEIAIVRSYSKKTFQNQKALSLVKNLLSAYRDQAWSGHSERTNQKNI